MKPITRRPVGLLDDLLETTPHQLLELHPLLDHGGAAATLEQRLLDPREAAAQHAHDQVVGVVGLGPRRAVTVELLQQRDHPVGDRAQHVPARVRTSLSVWPVHNLGRKRTKPKTTQS